MSSTAIFFSSENEHLLQKASTYFIKSGFNVFINRGLLGVYYYSLLGIYPFIHDILLLIDSFPRDLRKTMVASSAMFKYLNLS